jgi:hypothetical protein
MSPASSTVFSLFVSTLNCTVCWFCVTMSTAVFCPLSVSTSHCTTVGSVSLCPLMASTVCPLSVSTSHCTVCWFCVSMSTAVFCSLSHVCQYFTLYRLLVLCHCVHYCLLQSVHSLSIPDTVPSFGCVTISTAVFSSLSTVCQYLTLYRLLVLCHCVQCCLVQSVSTRRYTFCWFVTLFTAVICSLSTVCQYLTLYLLLVLCHYVQCCLLQSLHSLYLTLYDCWYWVTMSTAVYSSLSTVCHYLHTIPSVHCLLVPHTPYVDRHHTAGYHAAVTPSAASEWQFVTNVTLSSVIVGAIKGCYVLLADHP